MAYTTPPGWPAQVRPPDAPDWEKTATAWLFDLCPPDFRAMLVLRRHPVVLARFAALAIRARADAAEIGLSQSRVALRDVAEVETIEEAVLAWQVESATLAAIARSVSLVEDALRGRRFKAKL